MTLRAYVRMLRLEDGLHGHPYYVAAACGAIETYLKLADKPKEAAAEAAAEGGEDGMSAADRKKAESKRRKAEAKAKAEAEAKAKAEAEAAKAKEGGEKGKGGKKKQAEKPPDEDPAGEALAATAEPLAKASAYLRTLLLHAPTELATHAMAWELAMRKGKLLLALKARILALLGAQAVARLLDRVEAQFGQAIDLGA